MKAAVLIAVVVAASPVRRAGPPDAGANASLGSLVRPVFVTSDRLEILARDRQARYRGHARATRDAAVITCDELIAYYDGRHEITRLLALGRVEVTEGERWARGDRADFDNATGVLVVTGNPQARQGSTRMRGTKVTFTVGQERFEVENAQTEVESDEVVPKLLRGAPR